MGLLALYCGVSVFSLQRKSVSENCVGFGVVWVCGDRSLKLSYCFDDLTAFEQQTAAIKSEIGSLPADRNATEISRLLSFSNCALNITLLAEDCCQGDVRTWLIRKKLDSAAKGHDSFRWIVILFVNRCRGVPMRRHARAAERWLSPVRLVTR